MWQSYSPQGQAVTVDLAEALCVVEEEVGPEWAEAGEGRVGCWQRGWVEEEVDGSVEASAEAGSLRRHEVTAACGAWEEEAYAVESPATDGMLALPGTAHLGLVTSVFDLQQQIKVLTPNW